MLSRISIRNFAIIDEVDIGFSPGLNVITGETGAGKSIIFGAMELLLGERARTTVVGSRASSARVDGDFYVRQDDGKNLHKVTREIANTGKSRSWLDGKPVSAGELGKFMSRLVDMHGQYEHQALLSRDEQLAVIDRFGRLEKEVTNVNDTYCRWSEIQTRHQMLKMNAEDRQRMVDMYSFGFDEINRAQLKPGEDDELEKTVRLLGSSEKLNLALTSAYANLYDDEGSAVERLGKAITSLKQLEEFDEQFGNISGRLDETRVTIDDIARAVLELREKVEFDPGRLEQVLSRKDTIDRLKAKYGSSIKDILSRKERLSRDIEQLKHSEESLGELEQEIAKAKDKLEEHCDKLSRAREKCAGELSPRIERQLEELGMKKVQFEIEVKSKMVSRDGWDNICFMIAPNPGEPLKPLKEIASGGELSRIMLAIKTVLAEADRIPTVMFDEIDAGVGGYVGGVIGRQLADLSRHHQVICITHLPQIASFAQAHFLVEKNIEKDTTSVTIRNLGFEERVHELARLLGGRKIGETAVRHAEQLLEEAGVKGAKVG